MRIFLKTVLILVHDVIGRICIVLYIMLFKQTGSVFAQIIIVQAIFKH